MRRLKKTLALILCFVMALGSFAYAEDIQPVTISIKDYEGHWAQTVIEKWLESGKISGYPDGSYKPDNNITRAEFVRMVNGIIDFDKKGEITYKDVSSSDWYYEYISVAQEVGYISGYSAEKFGPNDYITREQAATILARVQYLAGSADGVEKFSDKDKISAWAVESVGASAEAGFIGGYPDGSFKPLNNLTRAEALTMIDNVLVNGKNLVVYNDGTELKDLVVDGDLIIAKTVGDGNVYVTDVEVKGNLYVYGGGANSVYLNGVKVSKVVVDKDKIRLVLGEGTNVQEIEVAAETVLENKDGTVAKVTITGDNKITLSGNFDEVVVSGNGNIVLKDAVITKLVVNKPIVILGTGTIKTLVANADGIKFDSAVKIDKTELGEGVTEEPKRESSGGGGGGGGGYTPGPDPNAEHNVILSGDLIFKVSKNNKEKLDLSNENIENIKLQASYKKSDILSDVIKSEIDSLFEKDNLAIVNSNEFKTLIAPMFEKVSDPEKLYDVLDKIYRIDITTIKYNGEVIFDENGEIIEGKLPEDLRAYVVSNLTRLKNKLDKIDTDAIEDKIEAKIEEITADDKITDLELVGLFRELRPYYDKIVENNAEIIEELDKLFELLNDDNLVIEVVVGETTERFTKKHLDELKSIYDLYEIKLSDLEKGKTIGNTYTIGDYKVEYKIDLKLKLEELK